MKGCDNIIIHTLLPGQSVAQLAKEYGVCEEIIRRNNALEGECAVGEQLLILVPTRTYNVCQRDSLDRIALRFGISKRELVAKNPTVAEQGLTPGETLVIKYSEPIYGMGASNGYFYKGCSLSQMRRALPYLTYITVAAASESQGDVKMLFDDKAIVDEAITNDKIPLLRIYRQQEERRYTKEYCNRLCESIIEAAKEGNYSGVVLSEEVCDGYGDFIMELRHKMIGSDLILLTEISENYDTTANEYADGSIISYDKYADASPVSFSDGEKRVFSDFACNAESSKTFISLPSLAAWGRGYSDISDAIAAARQYGCEISTDSDSLISSFSSSRRGNLSFASLENIKAILDLVNEYGYMGVSFDIMRTPLSHFMMYNNLFRTVTHTRVRAVEGCSRSD